MHFPKATPFVDAGLARHGPPGGHSCPVTLAIRLKGSPGQQLSVHMVPLWELEQVCLWVASTCVQLPGPSVRPFAWHSHSRNSPGHWDCHFLA